MDPVTVLTGALLPIFPDFEGDRDLVPVLFARLGRGQPVPVGELAEAVAWPEARVRDCLASWWGIRFDESGRIGGFWGLDTAPTQHRLELEGRTLYAWCAWDTLFLPDLLGEPALVESRCPLANRPVRLEVAPEGVAWAKPGDCRLGLVPPEPRAVQAGVQEAFCWGYAF